MVAEGFTVNNEKVAVEAVGPPITFVNVFRYPTYHPDDTLTSALAQYGKVKGVAFATVTNRQTKLNAARGLLADHENTTKNDRATVLVRSDGRPEKPNLQVLRPRPPGLTPSNAPKQWDTELTSMSDSKTAEATSLGTSAAPPENTEDASSVGAHGDLATGSGAETSSPRLIT
ncbi:hypothetical protein MTO96_040749 [Rhipicephalus appendiculatus]